MEVLEVVGDDSVVEVHLWFEFFEVIACDGACVSLFGSFEGELAFEVFEGLEFGDEFIL